MNKVDGTHRELRESLGTTNSTAQRLWIGDSHSAVGAHSTANPASRTPHSSRLGTGHSTHHASTASSRQHRMPFRNPHSTLDHLHPANLLNTTHDSRRYRSNARDETKSRFRKTAEKGKEARVALSPPIESTASSEVATVVGH